jgi:hypothetical protein
MTRYKLFLTAMICGLLWAQSEMARAQGRTPAPRASRYSPARPVMSPYLNLLRRNSSTLSNYYSFVKPEQRQRAINRQGQARMRQQSNSLMHLQNDVQLGQAPVRDTGKGGGFMTGGSRFMTSGSYFGGR